MPATHSIFLSYRRSDSNDVTGRIYDRLTEHFGRDLVFKDVDSIPFGVDFRTHLNQSVGNCQVLVAVIGLTWLSVQDAEGKRRLDHPKDWVRAEIETAMGREIPVIPLLVGGARPPSAEALPKSLEKLAYRNAVQIRPDPDFHRDMNRLIEGLEKIVGAPEKVKEQVTVGTKQASNSRKGFYERQIAQLEEELATVESDLEAAPREVDRLRLEKAAEQLLNKIEALKTKLHSL